MVVIPVIRTPGVQTFPGATPVPATRDSLGMDSDAQLLSSSPSVVQDTSLGARDAWVRE